MQRMWCFLLFTRWLCYCNVPAFCDSLPRHETTMIFGHTLLKFVFQTMRKQLLDKFRAEKDKMPPEKRTLVLTHFPRSAKLCVVEYFHICANVQPCSESLHIMALHKLLLYYYRVKTLVSDNDILMQHTSYFIAMNWPTV